MKLKLKQEKIIFGWLWVVAIKPKDKDILHIHISAEKNMFVAEHFLRSLVNKYGRYPVSTDGGGGTWYPQACKFLQIKHHLHSLYEKNIIERRIQYIKDRTQNALINFPCRKEKCSRLEHIINWFYVFVDYHNKEMIA